MASRTIVQLIDDIDGTDASETVSFGLDGVTYEIDLRDEHAEQLRTALGEWTVHARRVAGRVSTKKVATVTASPTKKVQNMNGTRNGKHSPREMRDWARSNGFEDVPDKGRVSQVIQDAFAAAH